MVSSETEKVSFLLFLKIVEASQCSARDSTKLTLQYTWVEPLSLNGVALFDRDKKAFAIT